MSDSPVRSIRRQKTIKASGRTTGKSRLKVGNEPECARFLRVNYHFKGLNHRWIQDFPRGAKICRMKMKRIGPRGEHVSKNLLCRSTTVNTQFKIDLDAHTEAYLQTELNGFFPHTKFKLVYTNRILLSEGRNAHWSWNQYFWRQGSTRTRNRLRQGSVLLWCSSCIRN